jgi:hypothetical protein
MKYRTYTLTFTLAAALLAQPLAAESYQCSFTTECFEAESCSETAFNMSIEDNNGQFSLVSDAETIATTTGGSDALKIYVGYTSSAFHLMSRSTDGPARYSTHIFEGPLMVNYLGTCKEAQ